MGFDALSGSEAAKIEALSKQGVNCANLICYATLERQ